MANSDNDSLPYQVLVQASSLFAGTSGLSHSEMENFFCYQLNKPFEELNLPPAKNRAERFQQFLSLFPPGKQKELLVQLCREDLPMYFSRPTEEARNQLADRLLSSGPVVASAAALNQFNAEEVTRCWRKASERLTGDPDGAITAARSLIESVCKHILDDAGEVYKPAEKLPALYSKTASLLNLSPGQHDEQLFRQILGSCTQVVEGIASIRNGLGDAHGKGRTAPRPQPRHAELVVNLAGTMAVFLMKTRETRK